MVLRGKIKSEKRSFSSRFHEKKERRIWLFWFLVNLPAQSDLAVDSSHLRASLWPLDQNPVSSHTIWAKWAEWGILWLRSNIEKMAHLALFLGR
jgi:hypothetical protein